VFESSEEDAPGPAGLSLLPGTVVRFSEKQGGGIKVPHMGWNTITWRRDDPLFAGLGQGAAVYFVHGYYAKPADNGAATSAVCDYGGPFCASVWRDNLWATQFHPEKSQRVGLKILSNFAEF
jgi:glutamine amidotransferase